MSTIARFSLGTLFSFSCAYALTLHETMEFTLQHSPELEMNLQKRDIKKAELSQAYAEFFPTIKLTGELSDQDFKEIEGAENRASYWKREGSLEISQNLFDGLSRYYQVRQQRSELRSAQYVYQNSAEELTLKIAQLFFEIEHAQAVIDMAKDNFNKIFEIKELIAKRVEEGVSKDIDLIQAQGRLSVAKTNILESIKNLRALKAQFHQITGGLFPEELKIPELKALDAQSFDNLWKRIEQEGHQIRPYHALQESALNSYQSQYGKFMPSVDLYGKYKYDKGLSISPTRVQETKNIGIKATWTIFEGGKKTFESYIQAQRYQQSRCEVKKQQQALYAQARQAWDALQTQTDASSFFQQHTHSAKKTSLSYLDQFLIGQKTLLDLLDSHNEHLRAQRAQSYNEMQRKSSHLELSLLSGKIFSDLNLQLSAQQFLTSAELESLESSYGVIDRPSHS